MSKLPVPTAKEINEAHQFAKEHAETAIDWAVKCGQLLSAKKEALGRGQFDEWLQTYCEFGRAMAYNYMKAAKSSNALDGFTSLRQALGYESHKPGQRPTTNSPKGAVPVVKAPAQPEATGETGADRPAAPASSPPASPAPEPTPQAGEPEWTPEDEARAVAEQESAERGRIDAAMAADDKLAEAFRQIKLQQAEIAVLTRSRDHYMNEAGAAARLVKARDREIAKLKRQIGRQAA